MLKIFKSIHPTLFALSITFCAYAQDLSPVPGQGRILYVPDGWVNISDRLAQGNVGDVPQGLLQSAESTSCQLLAYDPSTARDAYPVYMMQTHYVQYDVIKFNPGYLQDFENELKDSLTKSKTKSLDDIGVLTLHNSDVLYYIVDMPVKVNAKGDTVDARMMIYFVPNGNQAAILTFTCPRRDWQQYDPIFEDAVDKTLE